MLKEIGLARREVDVLSVIWMVERRMDENEEMRKERDGKRRGVFHEGSGLEERFDFGKHMERTFREVYLVDPNCCSWTVRQDEPQASKLECF